MLREIDYGPCDSDVINLDEWVFNTEAHPLKVIKRDSTMAGLVICIPIQAIHSFLVSWFLGFFVSSFLRFFVFLVSSFLRFFVVSLLLCFFVSDFLLFHSLDVMLNRGKMRGQSTAAAARQ